MPASRYSRASSRSPTRTAMSYTSTTVGQQKAPVVKRLIIEGNAERATDGKADGAALKMYLKISIPVTSIVPGGTIPLFAEENLKILDSQVHPLDAQSVPYNFSSTTSPLLRKAARSLGLSARSREPYTALFGSVSSSSSASLPPLDVKYSGHILVSGYSVSYVLPKEFPPRTFENDNYGKRAGKEIHFMAAIDVWAPFVSKPPHSPYLLSIPVPRCLHNYVRLRIFPPAPSSLASSLASLSSAEGEANTWDLTSDPAVTSRNGRKGLSRSRSYNNFADDESSDSSGTNGFPDGYRIQGSFISTDRLRVRWAAPVKARDVPETSDGRRRVGIREVRGDLTCAVLWADKGKSRGRSAEDEDSGVVMKVEYTATCKGVWFPGVATMLGMDVCLDAGDCDISWAADGDRKWVVSGGAGFTGFSAGPPTPHTLSHQPSHEAPPIHVLPSSPDSRNGLLLPNRRDAEEQSHGNSPASLLRAPLPYEANAGDYSFEGSPNMTPISSIASLATVPSSPERDRRSKTSSISRMDTDGEDASREGPSPRIPITVHLNMNELGPPATNSFTFHISGSIVLKPHRTNLFFASSPVFSGSPGSEDDNENPSVLPLPQFHVLYGDNETLSTIMLNETNHAALHIYDSSGSILDAQSRKTVLQPGAQTKCGTGGARFSVRTTPTKRATSSHRRRDDSMESVRRPPSRPRTPSDGGFLRRTASSTSLYRDGRSLMFTTPKPRRDGPLMIPSVSATITPLVPHSGKLPTEYAVRVILPAPSDSDSEWLDFGLAQLPSPKPGSAPSSVEPRPPRVEVASASVEGVPVRFETSAALKPEGDLPALGLTFDETSAKEWMTWVKVHVGDTGGGNVQVVYLVKTDEQDAPDEKTTWGKVKARVKNEAVLDVLLPTFSLPVGTMEVNIETQSDFELTVKSNFTHQQSSSAGLRLLHYSLPEFFYPNMKIAITPAAASRTQSSMSGWLALAVIACMIPTVVALLAIADKQVLGAELAQVQHALDNCNAALEGAAVIVPETITETRTMTTTIHTASPSQHKWWSSPDSSSETDSPAVPTMLPSPSTSTAIPTLTPTVPPKTLSPTETSLLPIRDLPFLWPIRFDIPSLEIPEAARSTAAAVMRGIGMAWHVFRKVLHYPLDPP